MKKFLITVLMAGGLFLPFFKASAEKLETSGYNCHSWLEVTWIQVLQTPICVGKAKCWQKGKCPNKSIPCIAYHAKEMDLFCKTNGRTCPSDPVRCIEDTSNTIRAVQLIKKRD